MQLTNMQWIAMFSVPQDKRQAVLDALEAPDYPYLTTDPEVNYLVDCVLDELEIVPFSSLPLDEREAYKREATFGK